MKLGKKIEIVRLLGIDAPEVASKITKEECFGISARLALKKALQGKSVYLQRVSDSKNRDVYGRLLRMVYEKNDKEGKNPINGFMVNKGFAYWYRRSPPSLQNQYEKFEQHARKQKNGLWNLQTCNGKKILR